MDTADVVVVGSGAGGGAAAYALTKAGAHVLLLERGAHYTAKDFFHDELSVCRRNFFVPKEPRMVARDGKPAERSAETWIATCVGGGTVHMSGYFFRMERQDLAGWPLRFEELEPYYDAVERIIGVSGTPRMAPILAHPAAALVEGACRKAGLAPFPIPRAIISEEFRGRQACTYCGFCGSYGCEVGAKSSSLATFVALAERTGKLSLRSRCRVTKVGKGELTYVDADGRERRARGRAIVLACSAIETARLLLVSGLGGPSVGKNLMFAMLASGHARFARPSPHWPQAAERLPFIDRAVAQPEGVILFQRPHVNPIFQTEKLAWNRGGPPAFGAELKKRMREFFQETHTIEWEVFSTFRPNAGCDVTLDPSVKDTLGIPVARVRIGAHEESLRASDRLAAKAREVMAAAGALRQGETTDERIYPVLQCGTARMGEVVDQACELKQTKGVFVADSSSFASSGRAPFTMTIMANALRVGERIAGRLKRGDL
jgi:choline dehydrogenase-like flavoprotein